MWSNKWISELYEPGSVFKLITASAALEEDYGFTPKIGIKEGLRSFAEWYKEYYKSIEENQ